MPNLGEMTPQHALYIPVVLMLGLIVGYILGSRAVRAELERRKRRMKQ
ncbi:MULTISPECIES: hypothetical protein [Sorangium]|uniref:Lipopolysaccharide assembly protein A domain-containing protein n=1 Tax=Sorangium atrum TaxID=2995308 RepID=A0ABT5C3K8_9BACT|nr:hypothetical protein [Sorangium aterium]MDC0681005.1 hypothetical protein [Sorangium aterium]